MRRILARPRGRVRFLAGVLGDKACNLFSFATDDDVLGHDRPRKTAVLNREEDILVSLGSLVEARTLRALATIAGPLGAGSAQRVTTRAVGGEGGGTLVVGVALGEGDPLLTEATGDEPEGGGGGQDCDQSGAHAARIILSGGDPVL